MDWKLEVVIAPVADVERARAFYVETLGFRLDSDFHPNDAFRAIQVTPPGSACSIVFGTGLGGGVAPGSLKGATLVVDDIEAAHAFLEERDVANGGPQHFVDGVPTPGAEPDRADYGSFVFFDDPDGNSWAIQEVKNPAR
ncbi:MAG TPA: VOC family protein [Nocardioides sp.]|jgi:catechol 2,3-dioxygenase-like lactoylglutathione lyase family enzyme|uniref:VOC family protein n=1 Tax=Nocardioides sp. TaxID=35761 RepID=UPI002E33C78C|nr:VOC family protein [Nocardioides sp.]HEX3929532.1 VOC family protein [Nocardioides sp.]